MCDKYAADEAQLSKEASKAEALEEEKSISGWLAFFLWVGVGLGALISVIMCKVSIDTLQFFFS